jgi:hypothetical protein
MPSCLLYVIRALYKHPKLHKLSLLKNSLSKPSIDKILAAAALNKDLEVSIQEV